MSDRYNDPNALMRYITIDDYKAFGMLIAEYAIGYKLPSNGEQPKEPGDPMPWPTTLEEFKRVIEARGIGKVSDAIKGIQFIQPSDDVLLLRLPPKKVIETAIPYYTNAPQNRLYEMPDFYETMLLKGRPRTPPDGMPHLDFWYCRIGDYTVSFCG